MKETKQNSFKQKIIAEMSTDHTGALENNFELAKKFIKITKDGKVDVTVRERIPGQEQILLYLIGKQYAKEAGLSLIDGVNNQELMNELGIKKNSLLPWLKNLRDNRKIKQYRTNKRMHSMIPINLIEKTLKDIDKKLNKEN